MDTGIPTPLPTPSAPAPALPYRTTPVGAAGWPPETKAVVVAAAAVSFLSLLTWGGSLWMHLQPSAFRGRMTLPPWPSVEFALFVLRGVLNAAVIAGALAAFGSEKVARRVLLAAALCLLALALYQFATFSVFQAGLTRRRVGADQVVWVIMDGARLVYTNLVHGLLALALAYPATWARNPAAGWPLVTRLIVGAAAIDALVRLGEMVAIIWISLQPSLFKTIGSGRWTAYGIMIVVVQASLAACVIGGAAVALWGRRWDAGRRMLLVGAAGLLALALYTYAHSLVWPPLGMPQRSGPEWIVGATRDVVRILTSGMIHLLVLFAMTRRRVREPAGV